MKAWSWQCHDCYGAHKDIIVKYDRPAEHFVCPFCGGIMQVYELGRGFRTPPAQSEERRTTVEHGYRKAA